MRKKFDSVGLLSEKERTYLRNSRDNSITKNEKGQLRRRINNKSSQIDVYNLIFDLNQLLNEKAIMKLITGLFNSLSYEESIKYINFYVNNFLEDSKFKLENQKKLHKTKINLKRVKHYDLTFSEERKLKKIEDKNILKKELKNLYSSEDFILRRKLMVDIKYIKQNKERLEIFRFVHDKKKLKLEELYKKYPKLKYSIDNLYARGIIIPTNFKKEKFIVLCKKRIDSKQYKKISKIPPSYEIYPLQLKNQKVLVKVNPYYDYFKVNFKNFKKETSAYYFINSDLRSLLINKPDDYPEKYYPQTNEVKHTFS